MKATIFWSKMGTSSEDVVELWVVRNHKRVITFRCKSFDDAKKLEKSLRENTLDF